MRILFLLCLVIHPVAVLLLALTIVLLLYYTLEYETNIKNHFWEEAGIETWKLPCRRPAPPAESPWRWAGAAASDAPTPLVGRGEGA